MLSSAFDVVIPSEARDLGFAGAGKTLLT